LLERGGVRPGAQTPHYRTCIKDQGSNHIKIDRPQFDRAVAEMTTIMVPHAHPKERGSEGARERERK